jgi:hypothetical protein
MIAFKHYVENSGSKVVMRTVLQNYLDAKLGLMFQLYPLRHESLLLGCQVVPSYQI